MKNLVQVIALTASLIVSSRAGATEAWHTSTIKKIYPQENGTFVLVFDANSSACQDANPDKYHYVFAGNGVTEEGVKKMYAAAMVAFAMDKTVQFAFNSASGGACQIYRMSVAK